MSWIKLSDDFTDRPELHGLGKREPIAVLTYLRLLAYAARHLTDGYVPVGVAMYQDRVGVSALESIGYVIRRPDGGLDLPRFADHHPTKAEVLQVREFRAAAGRIGGLTKAANALASAKHGAKHGAKQTAYPVTRYPLPVEVTRGDRALDGARANGSGNPVKRNERERAVDWTGWDRPEWAPFKAAWEQRFRLPPSAQQRDVLWPIADSRPDDLARWTTGAPALAKSFGVIKHIVSRWNALKGSTA